MKKQLNKKNQTNNFNKNKISKTIKYYDKKNENINNNKSTKAKENINIKSDKKSEIIEKKNEINNIRNNISNNINKNINLNKNENKKNDEQLKQIKSGLDENLKFLFNFSYENFLNKESESESKKSASDYNNYESSNKKENIVDLKNIKGKDISYQPKYK